MTIYLNLFLISLILVFIIDISGIVDAIKRMIWKWAYQGKKDFKDFTIKPFDCSLCSTWWVGLIYLCFTELTWVNVSYVALLAFLTPVFKDMLILLKDLAVKIIDTIYYYFNL